METEHTKTPWYSRQTGFGVVHLLQWENDATAFGSINTMRDAAFIVTACNAYEKDQEIKTKMFEALLSSVGLLDALESIGAAKSLPGFERVKSRIKSAISSYESK